ncbi:MGDG synthase family glycosyltransferase [Paenibacillus medicaginis]|uniref:Glycosyltransferase n=1 Tax=Paenibacillus medicaginis TaxID=1470560 RepID=A0ABV5C4F6_9BACL
MGNAKPKILILYASYGNGHYQASRAIEAALRKRGSCEVVLLDLMAEAHPMLNELTKFVYMQSFKTIPQIYGWVYNLTKDMQARSPFGSVLHSFGMRKLQETLAHVQPDLVIHTFPQLALPALRRRTGMNLPIVNVLTDFDLHGRWLHPDIDRYYVPTEDMKLEAKARGVHPDRVVASGIPIHPSFSTAADESLWLDNSELAASGKRTVLLMAGAFGVLSGIRDICHGLMLLPDVRVLIVCGRNEALKSELDQEFAEQPDIHTFGYVDHIPSLMKASDMVITKPGGITLAESIASGLPILIYRPVPGQELNNALYLQGKGAALLSRHAEELIGQVNGLLTHPVQAERMKQAVSRLCKPRAAETIADDIMSKWFAPVTASV